MAPKLTLKVARDRFAQKGHTLLEKVYKSVHTPMRYKCECGTDDCYISLANLRYNVGCKNCSLSKTRLKMIAIHGVPNTLQRNDIREKIKATNLRVRGVENPSQSEEVKEKKKATNLANLGVAYPMQSEEVREKSKATNLVTRGVENPSQSEEVREKQRLTNIRVRGVEHPSQSAEVRAKMRATSVVRYGVEFPIQNKEVFDRNRAALYSTKDYIFPNGFVKKVQGYEPFCLDDLLMEGILEEDIISGYEFMPEIWYEFDGKKHRYYPDIFITSLCKIIEVKSSYTYAYAKDINIVKMHACVIAGFRTELRIYSEKGYLEETHTFQYEN